MLQPAYKPDLDSAANQGRAAPVSGGTACQTESAEKLAAPPLSAKESILIIDDDEVTREVLRELLEPRYSVALAANGVDGVQQARSAPPQLVLCDVQMPQIDGFGVIKTLREDPATSGVPFIFLSASEGPEIRRRCMNMEADDYLVKPVRRSEVVETVEARLRRAKRGRAADGPRPVSGVGHDPAEPVNAGIERQGALLQLSIRGFETLVHRLTAEQLGYVLAEWYRRAAAAIEKHNGWIARSSGDSIMALFDDPRVRADDTARRGLKAGFNLIRTANRFRDHLDRTFGNRLGANFAIGIVLHYGPVTLAKKSARAGGALDIVGPNVERMDTLRQAADQQGWTLAITLSAAAHAGNRVKYARTHGVGGGQAGAGQTIVEVTGCEPSEQLIDETCKDAIIAAIIVENDDVSARLPLDEPTLALVRDENVREADILAARRGYRIVRGLGSGGMSRVYLARERRRGELQVLKFLAFGQGNPAPLIRQFLHEYELISQVAHPQVARIHDQWFADGLACIAMEYFPCGDLRKQLRASPHGLRPAAVLPYVRQIAVGLAAIHAAGIVHRDMKPDNVMVRADGTIAISDFGIAQRLSAPGAYRTEEMVTGTSYYVSPEQACGLPLTPASDIYSLGIMFYELLAGRRPFTGGSIESILSQHIQAPLPPLPASLERLQPVLDRMTAKDPAERFVSALAVIAALEA